MPISRFLADIFRVYSLELMEISRNFGKKARENSMLYLWFSIILAFSVVMSARLTIYEMKTKFPIDINQIFFAVFFLFMLKTSADFHRYFISSRRLEYLFASPLSHFITSAGIFKAIFWINMGLWALFSSSYILFLRIFGASVGYPWLYLKFTIGVMLSIVLGTGIAVHYFSRRRYLMLLPVAFIAYLWYHHDLISIASLTLLSLFYLIFALKSSYHSFGFVSKKERKGQIKEAVKPRNPVDAMMWKEISLMWRERLISSFIFTSISVGLGSGYIATHMDIALIPPRIRPVIVPALPFVFLFLGTFIVSSYLFIFPMLNTFLAEEDTLWLLKNLPIDGRKIVKGKILAMSLPLLSSLPFPFLFMLFTGPRYLYSGFSMLFLSFFLSISISLPFGIKYAGKRSDVMLLYTISVIFFAIFSIGAYIIRKLSYLGFVGFLGILGIISLSALLAMLSESVSSGMMDRKWQ